MVFSGMVLTVLGPANSETYRVGAYSGFFTPVDAHSGRWRLAPSGKSLAFSSSERYNAYACLALATTSLPRSANASYDQICFIRLSISTSSHDTKNEATDLIMYDSN